MEVSAKQPQLGNRQGFFQEPTVSSSFTLDEIVGLFPFFLPKMVVFLLLHFGEEMARINENQRSFQVH